MSLSSIFSGLLSTVTLTSHHVTPGKVSVDYNQFKNETTVNVMGQQVKGQPVLQVLDFFPGRKPNPQSAMEIVFLVPNGCPFPNFLADGKRVEPDPSGKNTLGMGPTPLVGTLGGIEQVYTFVFNFYNSQEAEQIATAKTVKYQICEKAYTLAPQDQGYLRQVLTYYNADNSSKVFKEKL